MRKAFGVRGCPSTVLIDRKARMVGLAGGGDVDWRSAAARTLVKSLLEQRATPASAPMRSRRAHKSVHLMTAVAPNDQKLNEILEEAANALRAGDDVEILFDSQSVSALRTSGKKTALEDAVFTAAQRRSAARVLRVPIRSAPRNQFEYIQRLAARGARVLVNANAVRAFGLSDAEIHPIAKRVSVEEMEKIVDESDSCLNYSTE